jgi:hypothetical protein
MQRNPYIKLSVIALFAIAMGYLESAVVVYLREIFYPEGFAFPLKLMSGKIAITEIYRELATILMLAAIGYLSGRNRMQRFGVFLYAFGIWDIFYYIFLKLLIGWPESLLTWDILFLVPVTWVGPVLAPSINALTMCVLGGMIFYYEDQDTRVRIRPLHWALLIVGSLVIIASYTYDYNGSMLASYVPAKFNWWIFGAGQSMLILAIVFIFNRRVNLSVKGD